MGFEAYTCPISPEEQSEGNAAKSQMSQIKYGYSINKKNLVKKIGIQICLKDI